MDLFEFITGMISVILALAAAQLFLGVALLVQTRARVRLSTAHGLWVMNLFLITFLHWWSLWDFRDLSWTFPTFFYSLLGPSLMFFAATIISPHEDSHEDVDLPEHFANIRIPFLGVVVVMLVLISLDGPLLGTEAIFNRLRAAQALMVGSAILGILFANPRVQVVLVLVVSAATGLAMTVRFFPGLVS